MKVIGRKEERETLKELYQSNGLKMPFFMGDAEQVKRLYF